MFKIFQTAFMKKIFNKKIGFQKLNAKKCLIFYWTKFKSLMFHKETSASN